jgi:hypothetical protein
VRLSLASRGCALLSDEVFEDIHRRGDFEGALLDQYRQVFVVLFLVDVNLWDVFLILFAVADGDNLFRSWYQTGVEDKGSAGPERVGEGGCGGGLGCSVGSVAGQATLATPWLTGAGAVGHMRIR